MSIRKEQLTSAIQTSLGKADSALQTISGLNNNLLTNGAGYTTNTGDVTGGGTATGTNTGDNATNTQYSGLATTKADIASPTFTGTVGGITKAMVGLSAVDDTSDATKNTATATLTNKTLTSPKINVGSDADGDIYYRASGNLVRLPKGTANQEIRMNTGATAPEWYTPTGGDYVRLASVSISGSASQTLSSGAITTKKNLKVSVLVPSGISTANPLRFRFNSDAGATYSYKISTNGGTGSSASAQTTLKISDNVSGTAEIFATVEIMNLSATRKMVRSNSALGGIGGGELFDVIGVWDNTSAQISVIELSVDSGVTMPVGTTMIIYGND